MNKNYCRIYKAKKIEQGKPIGFDIDTIRVIDNDGVLYIHKNGECVLTADSICFLQMLDVKECKYLESRALVDSVLYWFILKNYNIKIRVNKEPEQNIVLIPHILNLAERVK